MDSEIADTRVVRQAQELRAEAHRLLYDEGLLSLISAVGPTAVRGSYALDLMTWPDIDISVQLPHEHDVATFFEVGKGIASGFQAIKMSFSNQFIRPDVPFDHGLYWGIRLLFAGREWKIDLWGHGEAAFRADLQASEDLERRLNGADRLAILRIKDALCRRPEYRYEVSSVDVYAAVKEHKVRTVKEFDTWARGRPK